MGKGTILAKSLPKKKKIYGNSSFYIRPITNVNINGVNKCIVALRPSSDPEFEFEIEGEFGMGEYGFDLEKQEEIDGNYDDVSYVYYKSDLEELKDDKKINQIKKWAENAL